MVKTFIKIEGVRGHSLLKGAEDLILVHGFSFSLSTHVSWDGSRATSGNPDIGELHLQKGLDRATPQLMKSLLKGVTHSGAKLVLLRDDAVDPFYIIDLKDVRVTSVSDSHEGESTPLESVTLTYSEVTVAFEEFDHAGNTIEETFTYNRFET